MKMKMPKFHNSDWKRRISLVLVFTMLFSMFMHQGWYNPKPAFAAASVKKGAFVKNTATGAQAVTGVGFQPKAVVFWWTRQNTFAANAAGISTGYGFAANSPTITQGSVAAAARDAQTTTDNNFMESTTYSIVILNPGAIGTPMVARALVQSFDADGFTLNWATNEVQANQIHYMAIGGADITNAKVGTFAGPAAAASASATGVGFTPDAVLLVAGNRTGTTWDAIIAEGVMTLGFMTGGSLATSQTTIGWSARDNMTTLANAHIWSGAAAVTGLRRGGTIDQVATLTSMDTDGFTLNFTTSGGATNYIYLAIQGGSHKMGTFNKNTAAGAQSVAGVGFQPVGLMLLSESDNVAAATVRSGANPASNLSIGATDGTTSGSTWMHYQPLTTTDTNMFTYNTNIMKMGLNANGTVTNYGEATFTSFGADGFTINWATSDATARNLIYWAIGPTPQKLFVTNGTNPASVGVAQGSTNNALDGFNMAMNFGTGTVTGLTIKGDTNFTATNIPANGVKVWRDLGTVGVLDGPDVQISTASTAVSANTSTVTISSEPVTATAQNYLVTVDIAAGATLDQSFTGTVTAAAGTGLGTPNMADTSSANLTIKPVNLTVGNGTNPVSKNAQRSSITNALDGFSLSMTAGSGVVTSLTITGSANFTATNIPTNGVKVWRDTGTTVGWLDSGDVLISTASTGIVGNATTVTISSEPITAAEKNYLVTVDITAGATLSQSFTGRVTAAAGTTLGTPTYGDSASGTLTVNNLPATATSCGDCHAYPPYDGTARDGVSGGFVGDHQKHNVLCSTCHVAPATETSADFNHRDGNITMQAVISGGSYTKGTSFAQTNNPTTGTCSNISCHGANNPTPQWGVGTVSCVDCHNAVLNASQASVVSSGTVTQRRNVVVEFTRTWSHKRSAAGAATKYDCIVCHMEGDMATGGTSSPSHMNGYIDLRDPDTGTQILQVSMSGDGGTWNQTTTHTAAGSYVSSATTASFVQFSRDLGVRLEADTNWQSITAIQANQCLKCHDANGALSASAQAPGGSALKPFATAITGHVAPYNSNGNGNVVDVNSSFATANATYHPVRGRQNNSYTQGGQMIAPWNMTKTNGNNTQFGYVISCWDCHAPAGASGTQTLTVTAHGAAATIRAPFKAAGTTAATNLCINCHATAYSTTVGLHSATASAFGTGANNMNAATMSNCAFCHANGPANQASGYQTSTARPLKGEDAHGFDDRTAGTPGSLFLTSNAKPWAFFRGSLESWRPASGPGITTGAANCAGNGGVCNNNMGPTDPYTPGGAY